MIDLKNVAKVRRNLGQGSINIDLGIVTIKKNMKVK